MLCSVETHCNASLQMITTKKKNLLPNDNLPQFSNKFVRLSVQIPKVGQTHVLTVGIEEFMLGDFAIYPNPFMTSITIKNAEGADLKIINTTGQLIKHINNLSDLQLISLENLTDGVYTFCLVKDGKTKIVKVVKN